MVCYEFSEISDRETVLNAMLNAMLNASKRIGENREIVAVVRSK